MLLGCALLSVIAWAYGPMLAAGFVYEDPAWYGVAIGFGPRMLARASWHLAPTPLTAHLLSLALHVLVSGLVGRLAWRVGLSRSAAWVVAALVALHPMATEAVAYAAARTELIAALGVLGACLMSLSTRWWRWPAVAVCILIGVGGKETALVALALVPLTLWVANRSWQGSAAMGASLAGVLLVAWAPQFVQATDFRAWSSQPITWAVIQSSAIFRLIGQSVWPFALTVDFDYDAYSVFARVLALFAIGLVGMITLHLAQTQHRVAFGLAWMLLSVAPRLVIQTPRSYLNEHQFYVPFIGLILAAGAWVEEKAKAA